MADKHYDWKRFWCPRDSTFSLDDGGYLHDPDSQWGSIYNPNVQTFEAISNTRCLILLGEPGIGKSNAMKAEYEATKEAGQLALFHELSAFQTDTMLVADIFNDDAIKTWIAGDKELHLFLDSFDECTIPRNALSPRLAKELSKLPKQRLFLRIACRTADWPISLEIVLDGLWGQENMGVYELVPLRRVDVVYAAQANNIVPEGFLGEIDNKDVVPFAIKPVTLRFLIDVFTSEHQLPQTQTEIYRKGCDLLCEEINISRHDAGLTGNLSRAQRLAVAARIAAITMFTGRYVIWQSVDQGNIPKGDITASEFVSDTEFANGETFQVVEATIRETLGTGLFSARGAHRLGWAHQSYAEFLAAEYLISHGLTLNQIKSLIIHANDPDHKLVPQLHQVSAWLASMSKEVFNEILKTNPDVLLRSDISAAYDEDKHALTEKLLKMRGERRLLDQGLNMWRFSRKLKHPTLGDQLKPYIVDKTKDFEVRRMAIEIAQATGLKEVQESLCEIGLDKDEILQLRIDATLAIKFIGDEAIKVKLKPLTVGKATSDPYDDLKGSALSVLWPHHITAGDLFGLITLPKGDHYFGLYEQFLTYNVVQYLKPADLPTALNWVERNAFGRTELMDAIVEAAVPHLGIPEIRAAFARTALARMSHYHEIVGREHGLRRRPFYPANQLTSLDDDSRHALVTDILALLNSAENIPHHLIHSQTPLIFTKDVPWLLSSLQESPVENRRRILATLIFWVFDRQNSQQIEAIYAVWENDAILCDVFKPFFGPTELGSVEAQTQKTFYERRLENERIVEARQANEEHEVSDEELIGRVSTLLDGFEAGNPELWWHLNLDLIYFQKTGSEWASDLTSLPSWQKLGNDFKARIVTAARKYLDVGSLGVHEWLGKGSKLNYRPARAGYRALLLLYQLAPDILSGIPNDLWSKWAPIIVAFPSSTDHELTFQQKLIKIAYDRSQLLVISIILVLIDFENRVDEYTPLLRRINECWDKRLGEALIIKIQDPRLQIGYCGRLLNELISHNVPGATQFAESLLSLRTDDNQRRRAISAALSLTSFPTNFHWSAVWNVARSDPDFGRQTFLAMAETHDYPSRQVIQASLSETELADLYLWLSQQFPHDEDPKHGASYSPTPRDEIVDFRESVLLAIKNRGNRVACHEIQRLISALPYLQHLKTKLLEAEVVARYNTWTPCQPSDILRLAANKQRRLVQNGEQLLEVIIESLQRLQAKLQRETPAAIDLWNVLPAGGHNRTYRPKDEEDLSNYIKRHFDEDLKQKGVIANREVEIQRGRGDAQGERTDIHIDAAIIGPDKKAYDVITAVVEAKGSWNPSLLQEMHTQLVDRYLGHQYHHGLYVVGWFNCSQWADADYKKAASMKHEYNPLSQYLDTQARSLSQNGIQVRAFVLDVSLK